MGFLIVVLVFLTTFILMIGFFKLIEEKERPIDRLNAYINIGVPHAYRDEEKKGHVSVLRRIGQQLGKIRLLKHMTRSTSDTLLQADLPLTGEELTVLQLLVAIPVSYVILLISGDVLFGIIGFFILWMMPIFYIRYKRNLRIKKFNEQLGDALVIFSNSLKAGYSYLQAVKSVAKEMPDPISKEFSSVLKEMQFGLDQNQSLRNMLERVNSEDLSLMVTAIIIQRETGGNLSEILDNIASTIRDRVRLQGEVKTLTAQGRFSGMIVAAVPFALGLFMYMVNKPYIMLLFTEPIGRMMLGMALVNEVIGVILIKKIVQIKV